MGLPANGDQPIMSVSLLLCSGRQTLPANIALYCGVMYVKLEAVTTGQSLQEVTKLVDTVCLIRSQASVKLSRESSDCMLEK